MATRLLEAAVAGVAAERQVWPPGGVRLMPTTDTGQGNHSDSS